MDETNTILQADYIKGVEMKRELSFSVKQGQTKKRTLKAAVRWKSIQVLKKDAVAESYKKGRPIIKEEPSSF